MAGSTPGKLDSARLEGVAALLGVQVCFGLFPLFAHWTVERSSGFAPRALAFWRIVFGALVLSAIALARHRRSVHVAPRELPRLFLCGLLGVSLNMGLAMEGLARTSVLSAGLIVTLMPVFTYAIAVLVRQERLRLRRALGIAVALAGAAVLVIARSTGSSPFGTSRLGPLLMLANGLSYAGYLVLARALLQRHPPLVVLAWAFVLALPTLPLIALGLPLWPAHLGARAAVGLGYTLIFPTVVAYLLNAFALARVPASTAAVFIFLQPLVAGAAGALVLGEMPTLSAWIAGALLFTGICLVLGQKEPARAAKAA